MAIIGIDLGTTNSLVAIFENDVSEIVTNRFGENLTPSVVSVLDSMELAVGKAAKERLVVSPANTYSAFKRNMGTAKVYEAGMIAFTPTELSAIVLKNITEDAATALNTKIDKVVISVPAYFTDLQRKATLEAAQIAGVNAIGIVNEPTAAALAYHLHQTERERLIAVVDFGGGTYDISILDIYEDVIEVKAVAGDNYLGGEDFDLAIAAFICQKYEMDFDTLDIKDQNRLKYMSEQLKMGFDTMDNQSVSIQLEGRELEVDLSKEEFEEACMPIIARMKEPIRKALADAEIDFMDIEEVILVGGSTKMPIVQQQVTRLFGRLPLSYLNPDEVVAQGAAVYAALMDKHIELTDTVMTDVCPYTLGTETMVKGGDGIYTKKFDPIIERNMTVPVSKIQQYVAIEDDQKELRIKVYQGEDPNPENNVFLGEIVHEIQSGSEVDSMTTVRFTYDRNGILEVITTNLRNNEEKRAIMLNTSNLSEEQVEACLEKISDLKNHPYKEEENLFMMSKAEKLYNLVTGEDKEKIKVVIGLFREALASTNNLKIAKVKDQMKLIFLDFEERY